MLHRTNFLARRSAAVVSIPNTGKSTLFNSLVRSNLSKTGNYDFCTIDAVKSKAAVHDERLYRLAEFAKSNKVFPCEIDVVDVAGLIEGASQGAGLGNKFLADIRPATIVARVLRCFKNEREGFDAPDPIKQMSTIDTELILADMQSVEKKMSKVKRGATASASPGGVDFNEGDFTKEVLTWLEDGKPARDLPSIQPSVVASMSDGDKKRKAEAALAKRLESLSAMQLFSAKPTIFVLNVDEGSMVNGNEYSKIVEDKVGADNCVKLCALIEEQVAPMDRPERLAFLEEYGILQPASELLLNRMLAMLKLQTFFTVGPQMAKAWVVRRGCTAREAAGEIHGDFAKHFICARTLSAEKFAQCGDLKAAERKMQQCGAEHVLDDGDVFIVEHGAKR